MPALRHRFDRSLARLAVAAALVAALGLGACGRKGALDSPPGAAADPPAPRASGLAGLRPTQPSRQAAAKPAENVEPSFDEEGNPIAPKGQKKRFLLDWLLD